MIINDNKIKPHRTSKIPKLVEIKQQVDTCYREPRGETFDYEDFMCISTEDTR